MKMNFSTFASATLLSVALSACAYVSDDNGATEASAPAPQTQAAAAPEPAAPVRQDTLKTVVEANFDGSGAVARPANWRDWVFVGSPITPNGLNGGAAPFPEFHNVYVEPSAFEHYEDTGTWAEGTQIAKELVLVRSNNNNENGSSAEVSGIGYQQGEFAGLELAVKDTARFPDMTGGWAYFSFGHKSEPYETSAEAFPESACNACHAASADTDFVFTQFYPVLRAAH